MLVSSSATRTLLGISLRRDHARCQSRTLKRKVGAGSYPPRRAEPTDSQPLPPHLFLQIAGRAGPVQELWWQQGVWRSRAECKESVIGAQARRLSRPPL